MDVGLRYHVLHSYFRWSACAAKWAPYRTVPSQGLGTRPAPYQHRRAVHLLQWYNDSQFMEILGSDNWNVSRLLHERSFCVSRAMHIDAIIIGASLSEPHMHKDVNNNWGEPERAPHEREVWCEDVQYVCMYVCSRRNARPTERERRFQPVRVPSDNLLSVRVPSGVVWCWLRACNEDCKQSD